MVNRKYFKSKINKKRSSKKMAPAKDCDEKRSEFLKLRAEKRRIRKEERAEQRFLEARRNEFLRANGVKRDFPGTAKARERYQLNRIDNHSTSTVQSVWTVKRK